MNHEQALIELANRYAVSAPMTRPALHVVIETLDAMNARSDSLEEALRRIIKSVNTMTDAMRLLTDEFRGKR